MIRLTGRRSPAEDNKLAAPARASVLRGRRRASHSHRAPSTFSGGAIETTARPRRKKQGGRSVGLPCVSSPRKRGPILRGLSIDLGVWIPAFAGMTKKTERWLFDN